MDSLRQKLENQGLRDVVYMVVNQQEELAQRLHTMLAQRLTDNISLYKQDKQSPDVWQTLGGEKDDFFIYDRCGRLTNHMSLPYSIIGQGHVEGAIRDTYCNRICGDCTHESTVTPEECTRGVDTQPEAAVEDTGHGHHHGHHHGHGHHGDNQGAAHPHGHNHNHGHHHGSHDGQQGVEQHGQRQHHLDLGQMQQAVNLQRP